MGGLEKIFQSLLVPLQPPTYSVEQNFPISLSTLTISLKSTTTKSFIFRSRELRSFLLPPQPRSKSTGPKLQNFAAVQRLSLLNSSIPWSSTLKLQKRYEIFNLSPFLKLGSKYWLMTRTIVEKYFRDIFAALSMYFISTTKTLGWDYLI